MNEELMNTYRKALAENLPMLRTKLKMTQEELANILDISRHTIIGIETQSRTMTWTTYLSLIYILKKFNETRDMVEILGLVPTEFDTMLSERAVD
ncbi:MAG: hypothetical protein J6M38_01295 [Lentisphaeria bacterium]|nr:hypothetical protein [Lentisphaeria bacterium]